MKKQILSGVIFIAALIVFSVFTSTVFAGNSTHTITIVNQSNTSLKPTNNPHAVVYNSANSACTAVPPDSCGTVNMTPPASVAANSQAVVNMTGPTGCNISAWQTFYTPSGKGKMGTIRCTISPVNVCNSVTKNYTCTITQANVTAVTGNSDVVTATSQ